MTHHRVKALPEFFQGYASGHKPWSMRYNDRQFQPGDTISFYEWDGIKATGAETGPFHILSVWRHLEWLPEYHVMLSLGPRIEVTPTKTQQAEFKATLNWKDVALRLARSVEDGDEEDMRDAAKDARLFAPLFDCPSVEPRPTEGVPC